MQAKAHIRHANLPPQWAYTLSAQDYSLRGTPFNLTVSWDVMPIVGEYAAGLQLEAWAS